MIDYREEKVERMGSFFVGAQQMGYSLNDAWSLMLNSTQGQGLLRGDYLYAEHLQGIATAHKADADIGDKYTERHVRNIDIDILYLLADLIEMANEQFNIPYEKVFEKCSINDFVSMCGNVLGNYDDKLIKRYLL